MRIQVGENECGSMWIRIHSLDEQHVVVVTLMPTSALTLPPMLWMSFSRRSRSDFRLQNQNIEYGSWIKFWFNFSSGGAVKQVLFSQRRLSCRINIFPD